MSNDVHSDLERWKELFREELSKHLATLNQDLEQIGLQISEDRLDANTALVGQSLSEISFGRPNQCVVIAVRHRDAAVTRNPEPDYQIQTDDTLIVLAHKSALPQLTLQTATPQLVYRGARG